MWRNWLTRTTQNRVDFTSVWVRLPPCPPDMDNNLLKCEKCGRELKECPECKQKFERNEDTRAKIGWEFLKWSIILLLVIFLINAGWGIVFYKSVDFEDGWKIAGRILFCFNLLIFGIAARAFSFYYRAKRTKSPWIISDPGKVYAIEYTLIGVIASIFIFSIVSAIDQTSSTYVFYLLSGSVSIVAGYKGYAFLDNMKVG